ncbi:MAG: hypothetical protein EBZ78_09580, partial [Verrucomicrobia bacterium]|nr:hypothetical protein [Verrucomicrobiota bacterium]
MAPTPLEWVASACLGLALLHTFNASRFSRSKNQFLHLLSEVELVFAGWGALWLLLHFALAPLHERDFRVIPQANNGVENAKSGPAEPIRSPQTWSYALMGNTFTTLRPRAMPNETAPGASA